MRNVRGGCLLLVRRSDPSAIGKRIIAHLNHLVVDHQIILQPLETWLPLAVIWSYEQIHRETVLTGFCSS
jgi:hypothetical protein